MKAKMIFHNSITRLVNWQVKLLVILFLFLGLGCDKKNDEGFRADFSYTFTDSNHIRFSNESEGEYYSMIWDFGNGETDTTTDKKKTYTVFYPVAGDYKVGLKLTNYTGGSTSVEKSINVATSNLIVSFSADIDPTKPNEVLLKNTSQGTYDAFKWHYRNIEVENELEWIAYFPFEGSYEIVLEVFVGQNAFTEQKTLTIAQDDPNYLEDMTLVWSDEFDETTINSNFWTFETGASGWGNNELQNYTNGNNAAIVNGNLVITAEKIDDNQTVGSYTSSRMVTRGKKEFQYGKLEIRAKLPSGTGIWPAIWMLGSNFSTVGWPACGEMDIMEYVGYEPNVVHSTVHTPAGFGGSGSGSSMTVTSCEEEFHVYGLLWTEEKLVFYVDALDNVVHTYAPAVKTIENWPFNQPAFFILNIAVGGTWGGAQGIDNSIFPQSMEIDYVRVYQKVE